MCLRDHNSNNCTHSGNVCYCMYMVNNDYDKFRSFSRLYMTLFRHRTCTYLHGRADRFLVSVSNGQVAALSDWGGWRIALTRPSDGYFASILIIVQRPADVRSGTTRGSLLPCYAVIPERRSRLCRAIGSPTLDRGRVSVITVPYKLFTSRYT